MQKNYTSPPTKTEASSSTDTFPVRRKTKPQKNGSGSFRAQSSTQNSKLLIDIQEDLRAARALLSSMENTRFCETTQIAMLLDVAQAQRKAINRLTTHTTAILFFNSVSIIVLAVAWILNAY